MKLQVIFYDSRGVECDSFTGAPEEAARRAAEFIRLQGSDPDENGAAAQAGTVKFKPITDAAEVEEAAPTPVFKLDAFNAGPMTDEDVADALEGLAEMVRDGYTSGDAQGLGWWSVTGLTDADDMPQRDDD